MSTPVEINPLFVSTTAAYSVGRSLRFRSSASAYLNRTFTTPTNSKIWTWSSWIKKGQLNTLMMFFVANSASFNSSLRFQNDQFYLSLGNGSSTGYDAYTVAVQRDPSAWYHLVIAIDLTQATDVNREKVYVNGVQQTLTGSFAPQNFACDFNTGIAHLIGRNATSQGTPYYTDAYFAEINFIDGQQLTPSSFGAYDTNGVWQPIKYSGSYGTNGFYLPFSLNSTSTYAGAFNGSSQYLSLATQAALQLTSSTPFTIEGWVYFNNVTSQQYILSNWTTAAAGYAIATGVGGFANNQLCFFDGTTWRACSQTVSANTWYHFAVSSSGAASGTYMYLDGVSQIAAFTPAVTINNVASNMLIGAYQASGSASLNGQLSNLRVVKGSNVYPGGASFIPSTAPLAAITNTQLLTLQNATIVDNSSNAFTITNNGSVTTSAATPFTANLFADASGNVNNWLPNNISLAAGTTYDSMTDSPTVSASSSNYAVWNPINVSGGGSTITDGNLACSAGSTTTYGKILGSIGMTTGKWYWEVTVTAIGSLGVIGIGDGTPVNGSTGLGGSAGEIAYQSNGNKYTNNTATAYGATYTTNDIIGVTYDADAGSITFYKNNTSQGAITGFSGTKYPAVGSGGGTNPQYAVNFGQRPFSYTPPTGFNALNTYNLPAPTIANGALYNAATLYTGTGSSQAIANSQSNGGNNALGKTFYPDLTWIKSRSVNADHKLTDSVRGVTKALISDTTGAETTDTNGLTAFSSSSFTVGSDTNYNNNGVTYVGWQWNAGSGTTSSNTNGSITSTVSVNQTAGFSIVTWTGTGANATIGHGLGVAPSMIINKFRSSTSDWPVYHISTGAGNVLYLNQTAASASSAASWNNTAPTSSVFSVGGAAAPNGTTMVTYCFAAIKGYSAFGSYTGNGSTDGPFVYLGFRPRFVLWKRTDTTSNWQLMDTSRNTFNDGSNQLQPNQFNQEDPTSQPRDTLSNGFKIRNTNADINASGGTYIYAAFAENPFNYSRAR